MSPSLIPRSTLLLVHVMYGLHAFSAVNGLLSPALIVTAFLTGWPSIIAVIINYVKRGDARGTWLESHFDWQIKTFWIAVVASILIAISGAVLAIVLIGFAIWAVGFFALGIWAIYRILSGWLRLRDRRAIA